MNRIFALSFLTAVGAYGLSLLSTRVSSIDPAVCVAATIAAIALFRKSTAWGVSFILAELVFGSFGRIFVLDIGSITVTIRQLLFLVALGVTLAALKNRVNRNTLNDIRWWPLILLGFFIVFGIVKGLIGGIPIGNIIGDVNGYVPLLLAPIFFLALKEDRSIERIISVVFGVSAALSLLTFAVLWIFTHDLPEPILRAVYTWIRDERIGEITRAPGGFYRVFFQSHVWTLMAYFLGLGSLFSSLRATPPRRESEANPLETGLFRHSLRSFLAMTFTPALVATLAAGTLLISFSRAFWLAQAVGLLAGAMIVIAVKQLQPDGWRALGATVLLTFLGLLLAFGVTKSVGGVLAPRLFRVSGEAAADSRWNLLPVMWSAIREHPILGHGFGKELTYTTRDPRLIEQNGTDQYTTFAFEWGYLDFWLKMGLGGLIAYCILIGVVIRGLWQRMRQNESPWVSLGIFSGFIALITTHEFSPYLNHPLGIGFLLLAWSLGAQLRDSRS